MMAEYCNLPEVNNLPQGVSWLPGCQTNFLGINKHDIDHDIADIWASEDVICQTSLPADNVQRFVVWHLKWLL